MTNEVREKGGKETTSVAEIKSSYSAMLYEETERIII